MKKVYTIFVLTSKDVHAPSEDYYARNNQAQTDTITVLQEYHTADTESECEAYLLTGNPVPKGTYVILPTFIKE